MTELMVGAEPMSCRGWPRRGAGAARLHRQPAVGATAGRGVRRRRSRRGDAAAVGARHEGRGHARHHLDGLVLRCRGRLPASGGAQRACRRRRTVDGRVARPAGWRPGTPRSPASSASTPRPRPAAEVRELRRGAASRTASEVMDGLGSDVADPDSPESAYPETPLRPLAVACSRRPTRSSPSSRRSCARCCCSPAPSDHVVPPGDSDFLAAQVSGPVERVSCDRSYHVATIDYDRDMIVESIAASSSRRSPPEPSRNARRPGAVARVVVRRSVVGRRPLRRRRCDDVRR